MAVSNFTPSGAQTGLSGFFLLFGCPAACSVPDHIGQLLFYAGNVFDWDGTTLSQSAGLTQLAAFGSSSSQTSSFTSTTMTLASSGLSSGDLTSYVMPSSTENYDYKCFSKINATGTTNPTSASADLSTGLEVLNVAAERNPITTPTTSPSTSTSGAKAVAILAAVGVGLSSYIF